MLRSGLTALGEIAALVLLQLVLASVRISETNSLLGVHQS